ncbi:MAG: hypothetical protein JWN34_4519, partial [Bryobacterales bacterium]|nr:hypothetical protein [Bryobacterales bacterium]
MTRIRSLVRGFRGLTGSGCLALAILVSWSAGLAQAQSPPVVTTTTLPSGVVGTPYSQTLAATGGVGAYTWTLASGALPSGINLSTTGVLSGTPTIGVSTPVTFQAKDTVNAVGVSAPITLTMKQPTTTSLTVAPTPPSAFGSGVTMQVTVTPGTPTGKVTLYDGGAVIRTINLTSGSATAFSIFLPAGVRNLRAYYQGTTVNVPSTSAIVQKSIFPAPQSGFRPGVTSASGNGPWGMATADFNGDGNQDVVTANDNAGNLSVFTGNGAGVLAAVLPAVAMGGSTRGVTTGDFNEDGIIDIAATCFTCTTPTVSVMIGRGDGTFSSRVDYTNGLGLGTQLGAILAGDYNNDGHIDLAVANYGASSVSILLGNGAGTFATGTTYAVSTHPSGIISGDFNGDDRMDLAVANSDAATVSVFLGQVGGAFGTAVAYATGGILTNSIASGDFNGDGFIDLVTANDGSTKVSVLLGTGSGTFGTGVQFEAGGTPLWVTVGDFNGDHFLDLITANESSNSFGLLPGNGTGSFAAPVLTPLAVGTAGARAIIAGEFNGDFVSDVVISNFSSNTLSMFLGLQATTTVLTSSVNPTVYNEITTLTATVSPSSATGSVTFYDGAIPLADPVPLGNGVPSSYFSSPMTGLHSLTAVYSGDTNFGASTSTAISQNVVLPTITIQTTSPLPAGLRDTFYGVELAVSGLTGESNFWISAGTLPAGVTLSPFNGNLSGTPTATGTFNFTITVTDQSSATTSKAFSLTIYGPLSITGPFTISGVEGTPMSTTLTQTGGAAPFTWTALAGMPPGLILNAATGALTGTPVAYGAYKTLFQLTDGIGSSTAATIDFVITPALTLSNEVISSGSLRIPYQQQLYTYGGTGTGYVYTISAGALPAGLTIAASTGLITGTPTVAGSFTFTVQVADSSAATTSKPFSTTIDSFGMLNFDFVNPETPSYFGRGVVGSDFSNLWNPLHGATGTAPIVFDDSGNTTNVTMNYSGAGTFDAGSNGFCLSETRYCNLFNGYLTALASTTASVNLGNLPAGSAWDLYFYTQTATSGSTLSVSVNGGTAVTTTAVNAADSSFIAGKNYVVVPAIVDAAGNVSVTFTSANGLDSYLNAFQAVPHVTPLTISTTSLLPGLVNANYSQTLLATNGSSAPYVWTLTGGSLPAGLTLDGTAGTISGTATAAGSSPFTVTVTDAYNFTATKAFSILIAQPISITTTTLLPGVVGATYNPALVASGGAGGNVWTVQSGSLPAGVTLTGGGSFSGAPSAAGTYTFTVRVTDASLNFATQALSLVVSPGVTVTTSTLPVGELTSAYSQTVSALGGLGGYTYIVASGTLPSGITLNGSTGALSGTPLSAGTSNLVFRATDSGGNFGQSVSIPLTIQPAVTLTTTTLPAGTVGIAYNQTLAATNGVAPLTFSIATGTMPGGLTLLSGGTITGTPTTAGPFTVSFQVRDALTVQAVQTISIQINAPLTMSTTSIPNSTVGFPYSTQVVVTGGTGAGYVYALTSGALPAGVTLNTATGLISGSPTATGSFTPTMQVTDSGSATASQTLPMTVRAFGTINTRWQGDPTSPYSGPGVIGTPGDSWNLFNQGLGSGLLSDSAAQPLPVGVTWTSDLVFNSGGRNAFCTSET